MNIKVIKPGLLTTIQDLGRFKHQKVGVIVSGALDTFSLRTANLLVGNKESEAAIEINLTGPTLYFEQDQLIAITGAEFEPRINGTSVKMWRPVFVREGSTLTFGRAKVGCRTYIAVSGGFNVPKVLGSKSTYLKAGFGGYHGRALLAGDILPCADLNITKSKLIQELLQDSLGDWFSQVKWSIDPQQHSLYDDCPTIRAMRGIEHELFSESTHNYFWNDKFLIKPESDRMGYRLMGSPLTTIEPVSLLSSAVTFGTVQVPPQGDPIVLMADHQTTGGYPRIAQVISADLPKLAQIPPGKSVRFEEVTLKDAHALYLQQQQNMELLKSALSLKLSLT